MVSVDSVRAEGDFDTMDDAPPDYLQDFASRSLGGCRWETLSPLLHSWLQTEALAGSDTQKAWQHVRWVGPRVEGVTVRTPGGPRQEYLLQGENDGGVPTELLGGAPLT